MNSGARHLAGLILVCLLAASARAQESDDLYSRRLDSAKTEQKKASFLLRPRMDSPEAQLAFADGLRKRGRRRAALRQYRALVHQWHDSDPAPAAQLATAELLEERGDYNDAFEEYGYLTRHYSEGYDYDAALDRQFRIANQLMTSKVGGFLFFKGFSAPERALPLFQTIVETAPNWERSHLAQFYVGTIQEERKQYSEAVVAYEAMFYRYPKSDYAAEASFRRALCLVNIAQKMRYNDAAATEAITALGQFNRWYPDNPNRDTVNAEIRKMNERLARKHFEIGEFYETKAHRPKSALVAYRAFVQRFPRSELTSDVEARIAAIEGSLRP